MYCLLCVKYSPILSVINSHCSFHPHIFSIFSFDVHIVRGYKVREDYRPATLWVIVVLDVHTLSSDGVRLISTGHMSHYLCSCGVRWIIR